MNNYFKRTKMLDEAKMQSKAHRPLIEVLIFFLVYTIGSTAQSIFVYPALFVHLFNKDTVQMFTSGAALDRQELYGKIEAMLSELPDWVMLITLFSTYALIITTVIYCRCIEKRSISSMGFRRKNAVFEYFAGLLIGAVMFCAVVGVGYAIGAFEYNGLSKSSVYVIIYFLGYIIQGASEEVLIHGYYMTSVCRSTGTTYALVSSSLMFAALHLGNNGINVIAFINLFLFGMLMGMYMLKRGNIWGICAIHSVWNFMQGNVFGLSVSGMSDSPSIFNFKAKDGISSITGGDFGPEGGLIVTLVLFLVFGVIFMLKANKSELSDMKFDDEQAGENEQNEDI